MTTSDIEKANRKRRNKKCCAYIVAFAVFQAIVIAIFAVIVFKVKRPSVRLNSLNLDTLTSDNSSFRIRLSGEIAIKNKNFGHYKFDESTVIFGYQGTQLGFIQIPKGRAKAKKTLRIPFTVDLNSNLLGANPNLVTEINSGYLALTSQANLNGKVHLLKIMKKKKSAQMDCTIIINLKAPAVQDSICK